MRKLKNPGLRSTFKMLGIVTLLTIAISTSCKKDPVNSGPAPVTGGNTIPPPPPGKINPSDPNAVTSGLVIDNSTRVVGGLPAPQKPVGDSIAINGYQTSVEVSSGGEITMPFNYYILSSQSYSCKEYYIHVKDADSSIKITKNISNLPANGTMIQKIRVPSRFSYGKFCFSTAVTYVRADGSIYQPPAFDVCVNVSAPKTCGQTVSGSEGLTFTNLILGNVAGTASVNYNTYSVPDRIDVYYNNKWVGGTGTDPGPVPPQKKCSTVVPGDGFIGSSGSISFAYDPAISKELTVVVSGCLGNSTAWDYKVNCPQ
jgi:hypothetical protein